MVAARSQGTARRPRQPREKLIMMFDTAALLLKEKGKSEPVSVAPTATVAEAVRAMTERKIGAVLVLDGQKLAGIFTERDVMVNVVGSSRDPLTTRVSEVMTSKVNSVGPATPISEAMQLMSDRRHRHLPVVENGHVVGLISMGDVTRWVIRSQQQQVDSAIGAVKQLAMSNRRG
jgi:CBS domain-containing protein